jgi:DNA-directed RNA polymerase subunit RPC12/RpoP
MPEVTCPRCETRQPIEAGVEGYTCVRCGARWVFATCENCGQRFHMPPGTTSWTCPNCGHRHGAPAHLAPTAPTAPAAPTAMPAATAAPARLAAERSRRLRLGIIALVAIVAIVAGSFLLTRGGPTGANSPSATLAPVAAMCLHLRDLQTPRVDAFTRVAAELAADADAMEAVGSSQTADAVRKLRRAVIGYRDALQTQGGDDSAAAAAMAQALSDPNIPC